MIFKAQMILLILKGLGGGGPHYCWGILIVLNFTQLFMPYLRFRVIRVWTPPPPNLVFSRNASDRSFENGRFCRGNFKKSSLDWILKGLMPFLVVVSDCTTANPSSHAHHFPEHTQSNFSDGHIVWSDWKAQKLCLWGWRPPSPSPQGKSCKSYPGGI